MAKKRLTVAELADVVRELVKVSALDNSDRRQFLDLLDNGEVDGSTEEANEASS